MEGFVFARVVHVVAVVLWIGGVAMVTTVLIPSIRNMKSTEDKVAIFERLESRFATQAKIAVLLTGASGFYMLYYLDAWQRYSQLEFWWLHAMTMVWAIFALVLFVLEPLLLHRLFREQAMKDPAKTFAFVQRLHWLLLGVSLLTIIGSVAGSHGWFFFKR